MYIFFVFFYLWFDCIYWNDVVDFLMIGLLCGGVFGIGGCLFVILF